MILFIALIACRIISLHDNRQFGPSEFQEASPASWSSQEASPASYSVQEASPAHPQLGKMAAEMEWDVLFPTTVRNRFCDLGMRMMVFAYKGSNVNFPAALFLRSDGRLSYSAFGNTTEWHGSWTDLTNGLCVFRFQCTGVVDQMRGVTLMTEGDGNWIGIDQTDAIIFLKLKFECSYCHYCRCWHRHSSGLEVVV